MDVYCGIKTVLFWAMIEFFYSISDPNDDFVNKLSRKVLDALTESSHTWHKCENLHITLSKTVVLNYHWIAPFHNSLKKTLTNIKWWVD